MAIDSIFSKGFWKRPKLDVVRQGDSNPHSIYHAVGVALSSWEDVEDEISTMFFVLCRERTKTNETFTFLRRTIGMVESTSTKLNMLEEAATLYFQYDWEKTAIRRPFCELKEAIRGASHRRNEIAHGRVRSYEVHTNDQSGNPVVTSTGSFLVNGAYNTARNQPFYRDIIPEDIMKWELTAYRFTAADIHSFAKKFLDLRQEICDYMSKIQLNEVNIPKNVYALMTKNESAEGGN